MLIKRCASLAAVAAAALVAAPTAVAAPLAVHLQDHYPSPTRVGVKVWTSSGRRSTVHYSLLCGGGVGHTGTFLTPSGRYDRLPVPAKASDCELTVTASVTGYGSISIRSYETGR